MHNNTNLRYKAWREAYPDQKSWHYMEWIDKAKKFAYEHDLGVEDIASLSKYYSGKILKVTDQDLFTVACQRFAKEVQS